MAGCRRDATDERGLRLAGSWIGWIDKRIQEPSDAASEPEALAERSLVLLRSLLAAHDDHGTLRKPARRSFLADSNSRECK